MTGHDRRAYLISGAEYLGIALSPEEADKMLSHIGLVLNAIKNVNLTSIKEEEPFIVKHILDSLTPLNKIRSLLRQHKIKSDGKFNICDLGSGAGFPGIPLAIALPECEFTLLESIGKKASLLRSFISDEGLALRNASVINDRAEIIDKTEPYKRHFDIVIARAVASMPILIKIGFPLLKKGGMLIAMKGSAVEPFHDELAAYGGIVDEIINFILPYINHVRKTICLINKK